MPSQTPTAELLQDAAEEIERGLWRAANARKDSKRDEWLEEVDDEVISVLSGLDVPQRLAAMHTIMTHLEKQDGLPADLIEQAFQHSQVSREELVAWRLEQSTTLPTAKPAQRRI